MQTVVLIAEDNHGLIGVAETYADAIDFLIKQDWLNENFELYEGDGNYKTIKEDLGETWAMQILYWEVEYFNDYFEGCLYLNIEEIYKAE